MFRFQCISKNIALGRNVPHPQIGETLFLVVIIGLSPNSVLLLYCPKDNYKQKQWKTLPVTMITEMVHFNRLLFMVVAMASAASTCLWRS